MKKNFKRVLLLTTALSLGVLSACSSEVSVRKTGKELTHYNISERQLYVQVIKESEKVLLPSIYNKDELVETALVSEDAGGNPYFTFEFHLPHIAKDEWNPIQIIGVHKNEIGDENYPEKYDDVKWSSENDVKYYKEGRTYAVEQKDTGYVYFISAPSGDEKNEITDKMLKDTVVSLKENQTNILKNMKYDHKLFFPKNRSDYKLKGIYVYHSQLMLDNSNHLTVDTYYSDDPSDDTPISLSQTHDPDGLKLKDWLEGEEKKKEMGASNYIGWREIETNYGKGYIQNENGVQDIIIQIEDTFIKVNHMDELRIKGKKITNEKDVEKELIVFINNLELEKE